MYYPPPFSRLASLSDPGRVGGGGGARLASVLLSTALLPQSKSGVVCLGGWVFVFLFLFPASVPCCCTATRTRCLPSIRHPIGWSAGDERSSFLLPATRAATGTPGRTEQHAVGAAVFPFGGPRRSCCCIDGGGSAARRVFAMMAPRPSPPGTQRCVQLGVGEGSPSED